jgi:hypothetical protein
MYSRPKWTRSSSDYQALRIRPLARVAGKSLVGILEYGGTTLFCFNPSCLVLK